MAQEKPQELDPAAEAFEALRGEVALLRRAVMGLAAERASLEIPDFVKGPIRKRTVKWVGLDEADLLSPFSAASACNLDVRLQRIEPNRIFVAAQVKGTHPATIAAAQVQHSVERTMVRLAEDVVDFSKMPCITVLAVYAAKSDQGSHLYELVAKGRFASGSAISLADLRMTTSNDSSRHSRRAKRIAASRSKNVPDTIPSVRRAHQWPIWSRKISNNVLRGRERPVLRGFIVFSFEKETPVTLWGNGSCCPPSFRRLSPPPDRSIVPLAGKQRRGLLRNFKTADRPFHDPCPLG